MAIFHCKVCEKCTVKTNCNCSSSLFVIQLVCARRLAFYSLTKKMPGNVLQDQTPSLVIMCWKVWKSRHICVLEGSQIDPRTVNSAFRTCAELQGARRFMCKGNTMLFRQAVQQFGQLLGQHFNFESQH